MLLQARPGGAAEGLRRRTVEPGLATTVVEQGPGARSPDEVADRLDVGT